jgi:hypothetical protein
MFILSLSTTILKLEIFGGLELPFLYFANLDQLGNWKRIGILEKPFELLIGPASLHNDPLRQCQTQSRVSRGPMPASST